MSYSPRKTVYASRTKGHVFWFGHGVSIVGIPSGVQATDPSSADLSAADIVNCSRRFWEFHQDPVLGIDPALTNLMACHVNLFLGTLAAVVPGRPDLKPLLEKALKAEIIGNMFLTELGHGLDIQGLETVATKVKDGFVLNTPCSAATKYVCLPSPFTYSHSSWFLQVHVTDASTRWDSKMGHRALQTHRRWRGQRNPSFPHSNLR